jgi:tetratricopeptide (TPR) repeat protein
MPNSMNKTQNITRFEQTLLQYVQWVRTHQEQFWAISGTIAGAALLVVFMIHRHQTESDDAWTQLGVAQGYLMQGQTEQTTKALDQWSSRFQGTNATTYAKFLHADLLYRTSDYIAAAHAYGELAQAGQPVDVRPLALSAQSAAEEMAGRLPEAQALIQQFLDKYPDHFFTASMYLSQARLAEMTGNISNASALYDRFVILYPQSPWTAFAKARLQTLATPPSGPPIKK